MFVSLFINGWYIWVKNFIIGGSLGYSFGMFISNLNMPSLYNPSLMKITPCHIVILSYWGTMYTPGGQNFCKCLLEKEENFNIRNYNSIRSVLWSKLCLSSGELKTFCKFIKVLSLCCVSIFLLFIYLNRYILWKWKGIRNNIGKEITLYWK